MKTLIRVLRQEAMTELIQSVARDEVADGESVVLMREGDRWTLIKKGVPVSELKNKPSPTVRLS